MVDPTLNPYAPTSHVSVREGLESDVHELRRQFLTYEASIKSAGALCLISGLWLVLFLVIGTGVIAFELMTGRLSSGQHPSVLKAAIVLSVYFGMASAQVYVGWGLRTVNPNAKRLITWFSAIGLLLFPIGTMVSSYVLSLLHGDNGKVVFSEQYQEAIRQTPHAKCQLSFFTRAFVGLLAVLISTIQTIAFCISMG